MSVLRHLDKVRPCTPLAATPVASGDAASDLFAPYRRSQLAVIYSPWGADLSLAGLTQAPKEGASLKLVVPMDTSVWPHRRDDRSRELASDAPFALADPLQIMWDLLDSDRPDADQAVAAVKRALMELKSRD